MRGEMQKRLPFPALALCGVLTALFATSCQTTISGGGSSGSPSSHGRTSLMAAAGSPGGARILATAKLGGGVSSDLGGRIQRVETPLTATQIEVLGIESERVRGFEIIREEGSGEIELEIVHQGEVVWSGVLKEGRGALSLENSGRGWIQTMP